jgi:hypothetical protein
MYIYKTTPKMSIAETSLEEGVSVPITMSSTMNHRDAALEGPETRVTSGRITKSEARRRNQNKSGLHIVRKHNSRNQNQEEQRTKENREQI